MLQSFDQGRFPSLDLTLHIVNARGSGIGSGGEGGLEVEDGLSVGSVGGVDLAEVELVERGAGADGLGDGFSDELVGVTEGNAVLHQPVGEVGGEEHRVAGGGEAVVFAELYGEDHLGVDGESQAEGVDRIKEWLLVFLEVAVVGQGKAFDGG